MVLIGLVGFGPDGRLFASGSYDGTIKLWNGGDGSLHGTVKAPYKVMAVTLSNSVLVTAGEDGLGPVAMWSLWSIDTLSLIHTSQISSHEVPQVSISDDGDLAAIGFDGRSIHLVDVMNRTTITVFTISEQIHKLTFLPDKSHLVVQTFLGDFLSLDLINNCITNGPVLEHLIQLPDIPLWHGVPVWHCWANEQCWTVALFSQHQTPVPVLWIPCTDSNFVNGTIQGSSMIVLRHGRERIIFLRLPTG